MSHHGGGIVADEPNYKADDDVWLKQEERVKEYNWEYLLISFTIHLIIPQQPPTPPISYSHPTHLILSEQKQRQTAGDWRADIQIS